MNYIPKATAKRLKTNATDRNALKEKIDMSIDPLIPTSPSMMAWSKMFSSYGQMWEFTTKANLKNAIKVDAHIQTRNLVLEARFLDGCAVLCVVSRPVSGKVQDFLDNFNKYLDALVTTSDVYLIFDGYLSIITLFI